MKTHRWVVWNKIKGYQIKDSSIRYSHNFKKADIFYSRKVARSWANYGDTVRKVTVTIED